MKVPVFCECQLPPGGHAAELHRHALGCAAIARDHNGTTVNGPQRSSSVCPAASCATPPSSCLISPWLYSNFVHFLLDRPLAEELVRLPGCFLCYTPADDAPAVAPLPALANGFVTFGSFNALAKQTPEVGGGGWGGAAVHARVLIVHWMAAC